MSIAVSAVVRPSRIVLCLTLSMCLGSVLIGTLFAIDAVGELTVAWRVALALTCILAALIGACQILRKRCALRIDISGIGQIRVHAADESPSSDDRSLHRFSGTGCLHQLLPSSTLWSHLMILHLRAEDGAKTILLILPDTVSQTSFHALSVACHWIAAHNNRAGGEL